jgi:hypothetical protein
LEGSNDGAFWTVLKDHDYFFDSPFPAHGFSVAAWRIDPSLPPFALPGASAHADGSQGFQHFRIIQTGEHSSGGNHLMCAGIELYGLLTVR